MMLKCFSLYALILFFKTVTGQPVKPGEKVPDCNLHGLLNHTDTVASLSAFGGKAILLDFWAIFCQPCIAQFPQLKYLQEKYGDELQVITVTGDSKQEVATFFDKINYQQFRFVTATGAGNIALHALFPHRTIPHYIWISKDGILQAITGHEAVTEENIKELIGNRPLHVKEKKDDPGIPPAGSVFNPATEMLNTMSIPELMMMTDTLPGLIAHSLLTGYHRKYPPSVSIDIKGTYENRRIRIWDLPLNTMVRIAYGQIKPGTGLFNMISMPRCFLQVENPAILHKLTVSFSNKPDTTADMYCYDLVIPVPDHQLLLNKMKEDLYSYFGVRGYREQRKLKCYSLELLDSTKLLTTGGTPFSDVNLYYLHLQNQPFSVFVDNLQFYNEGSRLSAYDGFSSAIIKDNTGFRRNIDIHLQAKLKDIQAVKKELQRYGLDLVAREAMVEVLIIKDGSWQ